MEKDFETLVLEKLDSLEEGQNEIKQDIVEIKKEQQAMKREQQAIKHDIIKIREDIVVIKIAQEKMEQDIKDVKDRVEMTYHNMTVILEAQRGIYTSLDLVKAELRKHGEILDGLFDKPILS